MQKGGGAAQRRHALRRTRRRPIRTSRTAGAHCGAISARRLEHARSCFAEVSFAFSRLACRDLKLPPHARIWTCGAARGAARSCVGCWCRRVPYRIAFEQGAHDRTGELRPVAAERAACLRPHARVNILSSRVTKSKNPAQVPHSIRCHFQCVSQGDHLSDEFCYFRCGRLCEVQTLRRVLHASHSVRAALVHATVSAPTCHAHLYDVKQIQRSVAHAYRRR